MERERDENGVNHAVAIFIASYAINLIPPISKSRQPLYRGQKLGSKVRLLFHITAHFVTNLDNTKAAY